MDAARCDVNLARLTAAGIHHECRVTRGGGVEHQARRVARPVELDGTGKVFAHARHPAWARPATLTGSTAPAVRVQKVTIAPSGVNETLRTSGFCNSGAAPCREVLELPRTDLRYPGVHRAIAIREEGHELSVARDGRGHLVARRNP